jgi:4-hydroxybutyrate CoA-transferase
MDYSKLYQSRITTAEEAIRQVKSGQRIFLTGYCAVPQKLLGALVEYAPELHGVEICHALTTGPVDYSRPEMKGHLHVNTMFISDNIRQAVQEGRVDFTPVLFSEYTMLFRNNLLPIDVALIHCSPPDEHGFCSLGIEVGQTKSPAESAKVILAEVNQQMPRTLGDSFIHLSRLNHIVPVNYKLPELLMSQGKPDPVIDKIAQQIAEMIPDGATLQMGIGAIPDTVLKYLSHKRDLGIHSELFSDGVIEPFESGVLNGARKSIHPGKIIAGFILGSHKLYKWVDDNPFIELHPTEYVNDPFVIAQNDRQVAINSAIEVDLTGQVCADSLGPKLYSGVGGQLDFIFGASRSKDGIPIIAMPSTITLPNGTTKSRINGILTRGAGITTSRNHIHYVVTEFGIAELYGRTIRQRAQQLINITHPEFKDDLIKQAKELHYI